VSATIYQQADVGQPSYRVSDAGGETGHFATVLLDGHDLRLQTTDPADLDGLALVLTEAAAALRAAQAEAAR
jgi:hypothetical protein